MVLVEGRRDLVVTDPEAARHELEHHPLAMAMTGLNKQVENSLKCAPFQLDATRPAAADYLLTLLTLQGVRQTGRDQPRQG